MIAMARLLEQQSGQLSSHIFSQYLKSAKHCNWQDFSRFGMVLQEQIPIKIIIEITKHFKMARITWIPWFI
jgi:hypothetical protein